MEKTIGPAVLAIGSELLDGRVHESNALFVARALAEHGLPLAGVSLCDDVEDEIIAALDVLVKKARIVIVSGGLGPTTDDLTRESLAAYCGVGIYQDEDALAEIKAIFERRKRNFNPTNQKQALFPVGAKIIKNPVGTAPGFEIETERGGEKVLLIALPGVPGEFMRMFNEAVLPRILNFLGSKTEPAKRIIRTFGLAESEIGGRIEALKLDPKLVISYRAYFPEIQVKVIHPSKSALVNDAADRIEAALGADYIFSRSFEDSFEDLLLQQLKAQGKTVSFAESCTGGAIGDLITNPPGSSAVFLGSAVVYADSAKNTVVGVDAQLIKEHGAVSAEVAAAMALGARKTFGSTLACSITGIAGPDGGSEASPVGTYFIGLTEGTDVETFKLFFLSTRKNFKRYVAHIVLDIVRRKILGLSLAPYQTV